MQRTSPSSKLSHGSALPSFNLPATDGKSYGTDYLREGRGALVVFSCNHCPYVKGSDEMLMEIVSRFAPEGLRTVVISSNDAAQYPEDSFEKMKEKTEQKKLPYPYLYDETQQVAQLFDAQCTPECYLFDREGKLAYHGTINDNPRNPGEVTKDYLSGAIVSVLEGSTPEPSYVHPIGCSIKWRNG